MGAHKYHISEDGNPRICRAEIFCPFTGSSPTVGHYDSRAQARAAYENEMKALPPLAMKNGQLVRPGQVKISGFFKQVLEKRQFNARFDGSYRELELIAEKHLKNFTPGIGSENNDVILVNVPPHGFYSTIIPITEENKHLVQVKEEARIEGEAPVSKLVLPSDERYEAKFVKLVLYRADTLAKDDDRTSEAEWELVAVNADPVDNVPMHPTTMRRNSENHVGGTLRSYSPEEWARSEQFWSTHAYQVAP